MPVFTTTEIERGGSQAGEVTGHSRRVGSVPRRDVDVVASSAAGRE